MLPETFDEDKLVVEELYMVPVSQGESNTHYVVGCFERHKSGMPFTYQHCFSWLFQKVRKDDSAIYRQATMFLQSAIGTYCLVSTVE